MAAKVSDRGSRTILGARSSAGQSGQVIFAFPRTFPADAVELAVVDVDVACRMAGARMRPLEIVLARRHEQLRPLFSTQADAETLLARCANVIRIAYVRMARRHGSLSEDFHAYHNETHILDILDGRIDRLISTHGVSALALRDWCVLGLFAACHDLRQREKPMYEAGVGANERASIEETFRLLDHCGFSRNLDADIYLAMALTIGGSTFDARPPPGSAAFMPPNWSNPVAHWRQCFPNSTSTGRIGERIHASCTPMIWP